MPAPLSLLILHMRHLIQPIRWPSPQTLRMMGTYSTDFAYTDQAKIFIPSSSPGGHPATSWYHPDVKLSKEATIPRSRYLWSPRDLLGGSRRCSLVEIAIRLLNLLLLRFNYGRCKAQISSIRYTYQPRKKVGLMIIEFPTIKFIIVPVCLYSIQLVLRQEHSYLVYVFKA